MRKWISIIGVLLFVFVFYFFLTMAMEKIYKLNNQSFGVQTFLSSQYAKNNDGILKKQQVKELNKEGWELVFYDDFNERKLNKRMWSASERTNNPNKELQEYTRENVELIDGRLMITALEEEGNPSRYTSGLVDTKDKFHFLYGKVEVKGKYPAGKGLFPAIWMLRSDDQDHLPEIDLFESVGHEPHLVYQVHHWRENDNLKTTFNTEVLSDFSKDHIYGVEWEADEIRWYIDEKLVFQSNNNIPDIPMYLIINLAVGGNWPGDPNPSTVFPALFSIDYVKVYKRVGQ